MINHALEYLERGWPIIPIDPDTKKPLVKWKDFQTRLPTEDEVTTWWTKWPAAQIALLTGALSGFLVVDCDNDMALEAAIKLGFNDTPVRVRTKRGVHFYRRHPQDGQYYGNHAGVVTSGEEWPKIDGLDFRGDGGYVLLPPSTNYSWAVDSGFEIEEATVWKRWLPPTTPPDELFSFDTLDLSAIRVSDNVTEWERTERYLQDRGWTKLPTGGGNGRNERVMRYAAEQIVEGHFGPDLRLRCRAFMSHFFEHHLKDKEFEDTCRSVERMEKRNHPERFDDEGDYIFKRADIAVEVDERKERPRRLIVAADADALITNGQGREYIIAPWLPPASIVQVHGYSGSGKTLFLQSALFAACAGAKAFGPFEISRAPKVLYMDFELGEADLGIRLKTLSDIYGNPGQNLQIWTPWLDQQDINLRKKKGVADMVEWIVWSQPDVVVIDTIRTAWSGLSENSAEEWSQVNELALKLRNRGMSVVLIHHSNKPGDGGLGREAGSTNQLTVLETQLRVAQVYRDEETATQKAGVWDGGYTSSVFDALEKTMSPDFYLSMVMEVSYGKVRSWTDMHDQRQWLGWATHSTTGEQKIVSSRSTKQRALNMSGEGYDAPSISRLLLRPLAVINAWISEAS